MCRSYNAAARAARSGNALAILLAAIRKTLGPEDQDTMSLVDSALITHSQLTRDVGAAMSSAVLARRQVWLAQTSLPEGVRKDLIKMAVVPGKVFHPDSQGVFDSAESPFVGLLAGRPLRRTNTELLALCRFDPVLAGRAGARAWSMPSLGAEDPHIVSQHISAFFPQGIPPNAVPPQSCRLSG